MNTQTSTSTLDERPLPAPSETELATIKRCAATMFWCCVGLFLVVLWLASLNWQQMQNEAALSRENSGMRLRLDAEANRRHVLERDLAVALDEISQRSKP